MVRSFDSRALLAVEQCLDQQWKNQDVVRIYFQRVVYLLQASGFNFGYRFEWSRVGPYSPSLTEDILEITTDSQPGQTKEPEPNPLIGATFERIKSLLDPVGSDRDNWLKLVVSLHYLRVQLGDSEERAAELLERQGFYEQKRKLAWMALEAAGLTRRQPVLS